MFIVVRDVSAASAIVESFKSRRHSPFKPHPPCEPLAIRLLCLSHHRVSSFSDLGACILRFSSSASDFYRAYGGGGMLIYPGEHGWAFVFDVFFVFFVGLQICTQ